MAENTLKHGCGAINIDATRVGVGHHLPLGKLTSKRLSEDGGLGAGSGREGRGRFLLHDLLRGDGLLTLSLLTLRAVG